MSISLPFFIKSLKLSKPDSMWNISTRFLSLVSDPMKSGKFGWFTSLRVFPKYQASSLNYSSRDSVFEIYEISSKSKSTDRVVFRSLCS